MQILSGMTAKEIFLADLDEGDFYEIYTSIAVGFGIISYEIHGFNIVTK